MNFFGSGKITVVGSDLILHDLHEHFIRASTLLCVMPRFADSIIQGILYADENVLPYPIIRWFDCYGFTIQIEG